MDERDMLKQIRRSAEQVDIPDALYPDAIEQKLHEQQNREGRQNKKGQRSKEGQQNKEGRQKAGKIHRLGRRWGQIAAALALVICGGAVFGVTHLATQQNKNAGGYGTSGQEQYSQADMAEGIAPEQPENAASAESAHEEHTRVEEVGDMYHQAGSYGEIYAMMGRQWIRNSVDEFFGSFGKEEIIYDTDRSEGEAAESGSGNDSSAVADGYSSTNLVTEGVDEGDVFKTDGDYIYTIEGTKVVITDIRDGALEQVAEISPRGVQPADDLLELYVEKDTLILVFQSVEADLEYDTEDTEDAASEDVAPSVMYWEEGDCRTAVIVYDISDRTDPRETGRMLQDGSYETSRRIGDMLYLITCYRMEMPDIMPWNAVREEYAGEWLPQVNGSVVDCEDVYLPEEGTQGLLIASVDIEEPGETLDSLFIVDGGAEVYASADTLYLYRATYNMGSKTQIARFDLLSDGCIEPADAAVVKGTVRDTFALNEHEGYLRVLTTDWSDSADVNYLYILDENMELSGSIEGIAPGEEIYAARFFGDVGYFVTYRNMDPLFTVDLSDPEDPRIIGELEITGFSEYLHFWDEDHLVGIGYETDPETGERLGLKLSMFDISDPANVTEEAKYVLSTEDYSDALYEYKKVLISPEKNLIGFASGSYDRYVMAQYNVFSYENGSFVPQMAEEVSTSDTRGMYSGDTLYLLECTGNSCYGISSYDMNNGFALDKERE